MRGKLARRRGRLLLACALQREQVRGIERMLAEQERITRARKRQAHWRREVQVA